MGKLTAMVFVGVVVASTASAQPPLRVDQHSKFYPQTIDRVTVTLFGFSSAASSATVTMIGAWDDANYPNDGGFCRDIRPQSVNVSLLNGEGSAVWNFSNRFELQYTLQCRVRADDGMGNTGDSIISSYGGEHRLTLDPAQVAADATTSVDVAVWIDSRRTDGSTLPISSTGWLQVPVVAGCGGVTPTQFYLERVRGSGLSSQMLGTWQVTTTDPVQCPVNFDAPDFEGSPATLSVGAATPALPVVGLWVLLLLLLGVGGVAAARPTLRASP